MNRLGGGGNRALPRRLRLLTTGTLHPLWCSVALPSQQLVLVGVQHQRQLVVSCQDVRQSLVVVHRVAGQAEEGGLQPITALVQGLPRRRERGVALAARCYGPHCVLNTVLIIISIVRRPSARQTALPALHRQHGVQITLCRGDEGFLVSVCPGPDVERGCVRAASCLHLLNRSLFDKDRRRIVLYLLCVRTPGHPACRRKWVQKMDACILITVVLCFAFFSIEFLFCLCVVFF